MSKIRWLSEKIGVGDLPSCLANCESLYGMSAGANLDWGKLAQCTSACVAVSQGQAPPGIPGGQVPIPVPVPGQEEPPPPAPAPKQELPPAPAPKQEPPPAPKQEPPLAPPPKQETPAPTTPVKVEEDEGLPWGWIIGGVAVVGGLVWLATRGGGSAAGGVASNPDEVHFKRGDKLNIRAHRSEPGKGLTYPAMVVTASEDGRGGQHGGWDVYDGVTDFDEPVSFYGFSVESKVTRRPRRDNPSEPRPKFKIYLERVKLDRGGYDSRGRYWGVGAPLYRYSDDSGAVDGYLRASSRADAKAGVRQMSPGMDVSFYRA